MILLTYLQNGKHQLGVKAGERFVEAPISPEVFYRQGLDALPTLRQFVDSGGAAPSVEETRLTLAPVVPTPQKIICVGQNYRRHVEETKAQIPERPVLFSKFNTALAGHGESVPIAPEWTQVDYEAELAVVIGRPAKNVSQETALEYVLGYCNANDISERRLQRLSGQWLLGKSLDKFLPLGPYLFTADEIPDPQTLPVRGWLNGELRQDSSTADMIFPVAEIIAYASRHFTLMPGDVIITGTPEGVILGYPKEERQFMQPGDEYTVEIGPLGRLTNRMVAARG